MQLPVEFTTYTRQLLGEKEFEALVSALASDAPVSIRLNPSKWHSASLPEKVPWSSLGYYLPQRPAFTFDPLLHAGCYYVQEASSMFLEQVLRTYVTRRCVMLDLCAAPGGKSTLARTVLPEGSLLVSNEIVRTRAQVLAENIIKWGDASTMVAHNAPADYAALTECFDVILADVPCSGEGMFRKDEASVSEWSTDNVDVCWRRQRDIVADVWPCLKPGGVFIYSTCTYNAWENEENIRWMMKEFDAEILEVPVADGWGIGGDVTGSGLPVYRFFPSRVRGEGLFMAVLRKPSGDAALSALAFEQVGMHEDIPGKSRKADKRNRKGKTAGAVLPEECKEWLADAGNYHWQVDGDSLKAVPMAWWNLYVRLNEHLQLLHAGVEVATLKGRDWVPAHSLAMSTGLAEQAFARVEISCEEAIAYLRRESVCLDASIPRGFVLLTYRGVPLGFVKNLGNRANNLYPNEWRIRSGYGQGVDVIG